MFKTISILFSLILVLPAAHAAKKYEVTTEEVSYSAGGTNMKGFVAYPKTDEKRPGILVVHEWWGHNQHARDNAKKLAELGYVAFAVDMFGDGKQADHPDNALKFAQEASEMSKKEARFKAAYDWLKANSKVEATKLAAMGYCFGGTVVLDMARKNLDLKGVASFHGSLSTGLPQPTEVKPEVLVMTGADDKMIPKEQVEAFEKEMKAARAKFKVITYKNAMHGFTNKEATEKGKKFGMPVAYNAKADKESWKEATNFFDRILK